MAEEPGNYFPGRPDPAPDPHPTMIVGTGRIRTRAQAHGCGLSDDRIARPSRFVSGRARTRALVAEGWVVAEITWDDLVHRPAKVLDAVRRTNAVRILAP